MRKRSGLIWLATILLFCNATQAQTKNTISGKVEDVQTLKPILGVTVFLIKDTVVLKGVTDGSGTYTLNISDRGYYKLLLSHIAYDSIVIDSILITDTSSNIPSIVKLHPSTKMLGSVVVTSKASPISYNGEKLTFNVSSTSLGAGSNAYDLVKATPQVVADYEGNITTQGKSVLITVDGKQTNLSGEDLKTFLSNIPGQTVDKIEVMANPSAKYDAQGGAVINIKTLKPTNLGTNGSVSAGVGSGRYGLYNFGTNLNYRSVKTNIYGSYNFDHDAQYNQNSQAQRTEGAPSQVFESALNKIVNNTNAIKLGIDHDFNKRNSGGILFKANINDRKNDRFNRSVAYQSNIENPDSLSTVLSNGAVKIFSPSINAWYKNILNSKGAELTINGDYFLYDKKWNEGFQTDYLTPGGVESSAPDFMRQNSPGRNDIQSYAVDYSSPIKKGKIEAGIKTTFTKTDNNILWEMRSDNNWEKDLSKTNHFIYKENINAAYISISQSFKKYILVTGLRGEQTNTKGILVDAETNDRNYINLFPNISITHLLNQNNIFSLAYKRSIVRYGFNFVNPFIIYRSQYSYTQGNPDLQPQINNNYSFTWSFKQKLITSLSYVHAKGVLAPIYFPSDNPNVIISSYDNLQSMNNYVANITYSGQLTKWWQSTNTISGFHIRYSNGNNGESLQNTGGVTVTANSVNNFKISKKVNADITALYMSPMASGIFRMKSLGIVNTGLTASIFNGKGSLKLSVRDIFNIYRIAYNVDYQNVLGDYYNKAESRFVNLLFTYKFGNNKVKESKVRKTGIDEDVNRMNSN